MPNIHSSIESEHARLNEEKWDLEAETYDRRFSSYLRSRQEKIVSLLAIKRNQRLLDLGCGTGRALRHASSLVDGQGEFYGIDISSKMIEVAKANSSDHKNIHFYKANAGKLPFKNNFFDLIMCCNSFHHYYNPDKVLKEAYRVLNQKGRIYILDLTTDTLIVRMMDWLFLKRIERGHVKLYSSKEYASLFEKAGLRYIKSIAVSRWGFSKVHIGEK